MLSISVESELPVGGLVFDPHEASLILESLYVKEDHLMRAHLFLIFIGLLCYQHIRKELPENLSEEKVKSVMKMLKMAIAVEDESLQFRLANVNEKTKPILSKLG